jgi:sterol desaturase/sphingolipid hydroxylase (fatty acid hydroxylase superfamily)
MNLSPVVIAIPIYFILMAIEMITLRFQKHPGYRLNDAITNINLGVVSQVTGVFIKILSIGIYTIIYENLAFSRIPNTIWSFLLLFFLYDFCYYWAHRKSHEINLFWGGHVVHHSSEEYNLSVALRQSSTQTFWTFFFYFPLALLGFDPLLLIIASGINLLYQFWIHTEVIGKMGFLEIFMNTPSHHRVHHGRNPKYIDKNHGGTFIIFDKWFGTYQQEEEKPVYGITVPVESWNPIWVNLAHYAGMWEEMKLIHGWKDKVKYTFYKPGWLPDYLGGYRAPKEVEEGYTKFNTVVPPSLNWYILIQYLFLLGLTAYFLFQVEKFTWLPKLLVSGMIIWTTVSFSGVFEKRSWYVPQEIIRVLAFTTIVFILIQSLLPLPLLIIILATYSFGTFIWLWKNQEFRSQISSVSLKR